MSLFLLLYYYYYRCLFTAQLIYIYKRTGDNKINFFWIIIIIIIFACVCVRSL